MEQTSHPEGRVTTCEERGVVVAACVGCFNRTDLNEEEDDVVFVLARALGTNSRAKGLRAEAMWWVGQRRHEFRTYIPPRLVTN